ncbi:hypothetical protein HK104_004570 [Borealophlyctis nickersoniae]|nr:hypothetical protein HK104_004570 [Borealophlyctis nickersoniae]
MSGGPESLITQVQPPGDGGGGDDGGGGGLAGGSAGAEDKLASLITQVKPPGESNGTGMSDAEGSGQGQKPQEQQSQNNTTSKQPTATPPPTTTPTSSSPAAKPSHKPKSSFTSLFSCCLPSLSKPKHDDAAKEKHAAHDLAAPAPNAAQGKVESKQAESKAVAPGKGAIIKSSVAPGGGNKAKPGVPEKKSLLKAIAPEDQGRKCLVLDLDETLVHSSFKAVAHADFVIPVEIDGQVHNVYVLKRPGVDVFLQRLGSQFEIVVFTASLAKYADPVLDMLDKCKVVKHRLFREACIHHKGNYVKDLSMLGRDLKDVIIIDNSPASYIFHPTNAIPISTWFNDPNDTELLDLIPFLEDLKMVDDVMLVLDNSGEE